VRTLSSTIDIDASPAVVWGVLTDQEAFGDWNPFVTRFAGELVLGGRLEVRIAPPGGRGMTFRPTVTALEPQRRLEWLGRFLLPGVFDGRHLFELVELPDGGTRLTQSETFSGVLVRVSGGTLSSTLDGFEAMNKAIKLRAERVAVAAA
jgi:hypothetical protein